MVNLKPQTYDGYDGEYHLFVTFIIIRYIFDDGNIFAHYEPWKDDIIVIPSDCESDSSASILKKKEMKR